ENALGVMYLTGQGVDRDKPKAIEWFRKAAYQKNAKAMFNLGTAYYNGDAVGVNDTDACAWFLLAQEQGNTSADAAVKREQAELSKSQYFEALIHVAEIWHTGNGLPRNDIETAAWYRKAADLGSPEASVHLAEMLMNGTGTVKDFSEAFRRCKSA